MSKRIPGVACVTAAVLLAAGVPAGIDWSWGPVMPVAKSCRATATSGGSLFTVGGTLWETLPDARKVKRGSTCALRIDVKERRWIRVPDYPVPAGYASATAVNGQLWVIGGRGEERGNNEVFTLDLSTPGAGWNPGPSLPVARWGHTGGAVGSVIYVVAGSQGDPARAGAFSQARDVLSLDTQHPEGGWHVCGRMEETKVEWHSGAVCGGKIYLFGGLLASTQADRGWLPRPEAVAFNPGRSAWEAVPPMPEPLGSGAAAAIDNRFILIAGGYGLAATGEATPDGKARTYFSTRCILYDTVARSYRRLDDLPMGLTDEGLACLGETVVAMGGEDSPFQSRTDLVMFGRLRR